jgi:transcriptional regulator with XRE-family HTH domain/Zn-dependent peptidase ImmA (M78 family)
MCDYRTMAADWENIGRRVREARLAAKLSQDQLGRHLGLDRTMIVKIEAGTRRVDAVELARLGERLGLPLDYFLTEPPAVLSRRSGLMGLLEEEVTDAGRGSFRLEAALVSWLDDVRQLSQLGVLDTRAILNYPEKADSEEAARTAAGWLRGRLGCGNEPIESLVKVCQDAGLLVAVADLPGDGASVRDDDIAVAVVSMLGDPGRRRATAAHELGHLVLGDEYSSDLGVHASRAGREAVIDAFAAEFLLPSEVIAIADFSRDALVLLASTYRTSWSLAVRQAVHAGALQRAEAQAWLPQTPTRSELLDANGWAPQPDLEWIRVPPAYAHAVLEARRRHLITTARAIELMRGQVGEEDLPPLDEDVAP